MRRNLSLTTTPRLSGTRWRLLGQAHLALAVAACLVGSAARAADAPAAPAAGDTVLATFAKGQWDSAKWTPLRLPHQAETRQFVQRENSLGVDAFTPEDTKNQLDNVLLMTDAGVTEGEIEVTFSLSDVKGTAPGVFFAPVVKDGVLDKAFTLFVATYTMAFWRAETDPETNKTRYPPLARLNRWNEPNQKHVLRCCFSKARNALLVRLDQGDTIMFKDVGVDVNSRFGIWGCHGPCDFYEVRLLAKPTLEWSASEPGKAK